MVKQAKPFKITIEMLEEFLVPGLPAFIRTESGGSIPIQNLSEKSLRELGAAWTQALVNKADRLKNERTTRSEY